MIRSETPLAEPRVDIWRITPGATVSCFSLASAYTGLQTHWYGRTYLCPGTDDCPGCHASVPLRWIGLLPVLDRSKAFRLLELSAQSAQHFDRCSNDAHGLLHVAMSVNKGRRFDPLKITDWRKIENSPHAEVSCHSVIDQFARILGLPRLRPGEAVEQWEGRLQTVASARLVSVVQGRG
jgi:hypothetical protein